jgi:hypothetical protein
MPLDDRPCGRVEVPSPPVETEAFPHREHVVDGSGRKIVDRRESLEETFVVGEAARNPRPLKEVLGDEDAIRISSPPLGKVTTVRFVPRKQTGS